MKKISLPVQLLLVLGFSLVAGDWVPLAAKEVAFTLSLLIQESLIFVLPVIIFSYLFSSMLKLKGGAVSFIVTLLLCVCISNWIPLFYTYAISAWAFGSFQGGPPVLESSATLKPLWNILFPRWIGNEHALFAGMALGCLFAYFPNRFAETASTWLNRAAHAFLAKLFIPIVPLFILGFALKLQHEGTLFHLVKLYGPLFALLVGAEALYIAVLFGFAAGFNRSRWLSYLRNVFPSAVTGFSTMSSAATLPVTLEAAELNCERPELARVIIPATVNIHMIGESITTPLIAFFTLTSFGRSLPDLSAFLPFSFYFVLSKFAVAGVPGGGIIVLLPILQRYFDFNAEMLSLVTAMYMIVDCVNTVSNVTGNGAFAILFSRYYDRLLVRLNRAPVPG